MDAGWAVGRMADRIEFLEDREYLVIGVGAGGAVEHVDEIAVVIRRSRHLLPGLLILRRERRFKLEERFAHAGHHRDHLIRSRLQQRRAVMPRRGDVPGEQRPFVVHVARDRHARPQLRIFLAARRAGRYVGACAWFTITSDFGVGQTIVLCRRPWWGYCQGRPQKTMVCPTVSDTRA